jgi:cystathionine gamma-synthase
MTRQNGLSTQAIHGTHARPRGLNAVNMPVANASTFPFTSFADARAAVEGEVLRDDYARYGNPTVRAAEEALALLEGADDCVLFSSGMAALTAVVMTLVSAGQHVVLLTECYRPTEQLLVDTFGRFGVRTTLCPQNDIDALKSAIEPGTTRMVLTEWPTNPHIRIADLTSIADVCNEVRGVRLVVDATLASPANGQSLQHGAHIVVHSATKYLGGHNDLLAGAVCGRKGMMELVRATRSRTGATLDPNSAFLLSRGMKSLMPRMALHNANAQRVAEFLENHEFVSRVWYPGLPSHPDHELAKRYLKGSSSLLSFEHMGDLSATERFCDATELVQLAASLGGVESLMQPPALFSYWDLSHEERMARGMGDNLIRVAVGLEDADDIIADLSAALDAARAGTEPS